MQRYNILWADDEIELLKPHILFLNKKGIDITPVASGVEAIEACKEHHFDAIFLDENMPGMTGLETLGQINQSKPDLPVIMITKSEEEHIMEEAIASKISDYLIKPINPNQILLSVKKLLENKRLISERTNATYQQEFRSISMAFDEDLDHQDWIDIYKKLTYWEMEIYQSGQGEMAEVMQFQKAEANNKFYKFIEDNYVSWLNNADIERPLLSHELMKKKIFPEINDEIPVFFLVIDNLRYDQWKAIQPIFLEHFVQEREELYYSILPTTTAYARNSIFSGLLPLEMSKIHSDLWVGEDEEEGKNLNEEEFIRRQLEKNRQSIKFSYNKIKNTVQGKALADSINNLLTNQLNVIVYNFVDILSHARTEMEVIRELAPDENAYRSITKSWLLHSPLMDIIQKLARKPVKLIISTDHGTMRVKKPFKIVGDRNTNTNLRYKVGKNLGYEKGRVFTAKDPEEFHLPKPNVSSTYVFAAEEFFFAYPNNYNHYVKYYTDTFQHGGVSMEEIIIPLISLNSKVV